MPILPIGFQSATTSNREVLTINNRLWFVLKRFFDIVLALLGLILLFPLMAMIAILVAATSPGPIFYGSKRVGVCGKVFKMIKFRSMLVNADQIGALVTAGNDPRITAVGKYLRKFKWDELPSLWNVLKGDMSFVGPRPENPESVKLYNEEQRRILNIKPGITSLATIKYRYEEVNLRLI
jgi:lipopolysaccharide/colanic/teichoic acid biosynthesis glycosyltransferase